MTTDDIKHKIATDLSNGPAWIRSYQHLNGVVEQMIAAGHVDRTKPKRGKGRNMIGLTAAGAEHFGLTVDPSLLIEPVIARIVKPRRRPTAAEHAAHRDIIAERVSEGHTVKSCAPFVGLSDQYCQLRWGEIVRSLGPQAV